MFFKSSMAAALLALCSISSTASIPHKRAAASDTSLYAYGSIANGIGTNGGAIIYADGLAYIGSSGKPSFASVATNVTFAIDLDDTTTAWVISPNSDAVTFGATKSMYIVPTAGDFAQVGFAASTASMPTGAVTTGFTFFGTSVAYAASNSKYGLQFWAAATNDTRFFALYWNAGASTSNIASGAFPVVLKTTPPTALISS